MTASTTPTRALELTVVEHSAACPLDLMGGWLEGVTVRTVRPYLGEELPRDAAGLGDGLIVLGGEMSAYDDVVAPWLPATRALLAEAATTGLPTLGICLGAQLLAVAAGGTVEVAAPPGREAGVVDVRWRPEAARDRLLGDLGASSPAATMHADAVVDLPAGAVWLGATPMYPYQAFRVGQAAWGLQFHPEASARTIGAWARTHDDVDTEDAVAQVSAREAELCATGATITQSFVAVVAEHAGTGRAVA